MPSQNTCLWLEFIFSIDSEAVLLFVLDVVKVMEKGYVWGKKAAKLNAEYCMVVAAVGISART